LFGDVDGEQFKKLLLAEGFGRQHHRRARLGTDVTMSAPKSISIAALALGDTRLVEEHDAAVCAMADYLEKTCVTTRYGKGGRRRLWTANSVAGIFRHEDARPVDGRADPDLHSHAIVVNLTQRGNGLWRTVDLHFGRRCQRLYLANEVYLARLAYGARYRCGYAIEPIGHRFELAGIGESMRDAFSRRRQAVDTRLAMWGVSRTDSTPRQRATANYATRQRKVQIGQSRQHAEWRTRAEQMALRRDELPVAEVPPDERQFKKLAEEVVADATRGADDCNETDVIRSILQDYYGRLRYEDVLRAVRESDGMSGARAGRRGGEVETWADCRRSFGIGM
jgi:conjugative relaxase-like TrwC/TraI family protein